MHKHLPAILLIFCFACISEEVEFSDNSIPYEEVDSLLKVAEELKDSEPEEALEKANKALKISKREKYHVGSKKSHAFLTKLYATSLFDIERANLHLLKFQESIGILSEKLDLAVMEYNQGYLYYNNQDYQKALLHFFEAYDLYTKNRRPDKAGKALYGICMSFYQEGLLDKALKYALKIDMDETPPEFQMQAAHMIGIVHYKLADYLESEKNLTQAVALAEKNGDAKMAAKYRLDLALALIYQQKYEETRSTIDIIEYTAYKLNSPYLKAQAYWKQGFMYEKQELFSKAAENYRLGAELFGEIKAYDHLFNLQSNMVYAYTQGGKTDLAVEAGKDGLQYLEEASLSDQRRFLENMSDMYLQRGDSMQYYHYRNKSVTIDAEIISMDKKSALLEVEMDYRERADIRKMEVALSHDQVKIEQAAVKRYAILAGLILGLCVFVILLVNTIPARSHERKVNQTHQVVMQILDNVNRRMKGLAAIFPVSTAMKPSEGPDETDLHNLHNRGNRE